MNQGDASHRWGTIWASNGSIQTSDEREKQWRGALTDDEIAAGTELCKKIGIYQWITAIEEKGDDARLHVGVLAQTVRDVMMSHGLNPHRYSFFCFDEWEESEYDDIDGNAVTTPAGDRYSVRYNDLTLFMLAAQEQRLTALEERL
jgi:hypothetical protein